MNIYVGNLSASVNDEKLRKLFEPFGQVTLVKVIKDKFTGNPRGFAFVEMPSSDEAQNAIGSLNGQELEGQRLRINEARPQEQRPARGPRNFGGGNGGGYNNDRRPRSGGFGGGSWNR